MARSYRTRWISITEIRQRSSSTSQRPRRCWPHANDLRQKSSNATSSARTATPSGRMPSSSAHGRHDVPPMNCCTRPAASGCGDSPRGNERSFSGCAISRVTTAEIASRLMSCNSIIGIRGRRPSTWRSLRAEQRRQSSMRRRSAISSAVTATGIARSGGGWSKRVWCSGLHANLPSLRCGFDPRHPLKVARHRRCVAESGRLPRGQPHGGWA